MAAVTPEKLPLIPRELLDLLEERFPNRVPDLKDTEREVWNKVGNVEVVQFLKRIYEAQQDMKKQYEKGTSRVSWMGP